MPRKVYRDMYGDKSVDCVMFGRSPTGKAVCSGLKEVYCLHGDTLCTFRKTKGEADAARAKTEKRLLGLGWTLQEIERRGLKQAQKYT